MPLQDTHERATLVLAGVSFVACFVFGLDQRHTIGILTGLFVNPDLDHAEAVNATILKSKSATSKLWRKYWWIYGTLIGHRDWTSHMPIVSTLIRVGYLTWPLYFVDGS